jgi:hypothetical protein
MRAQESLDIDVKRETSRFEPLETIHLRTKKSPIHLK